LTINRRQFGEISPKYFCWWEQKAMEKWSCNVKLCVKRTYEWNKEIG